MSEPVVIITDQAAALDLLMAEVCERFNVTREQILARKGSNRVGQARRVLMYVARDQLQLQHQQIATYLGKTDSTVCNGCTSTTREIGVDPELHGQVVALQRFVKERWEHNGGTQP